MGVSVIHTDQNHGPHRTGDTSSIIQHPASDPVPPTPSHSQTVPCRFLHGSNLPLKRICAPGTGINSSRSHPAKPHTHIVLQEPDILSAQRAIWQRLQPGHVQGGETDARPFPESETQVSESPSKTHSGGVLEKRSPWKPPSPASALPGHFPRTNPDCPLQG